MLATTNRTEIVQIRPSAFEAIAQVVCDSVESPHTKRVYRAALASFLTWYAQSGRTELNKAAVRAYITQQREAGLGPASINQQLAAIRKLVREAADNGAMTEQNASAILRIQGEKHEGKRLGNWLPKSQAQALLNAPDTTRLKGLRDRAMLAVLLGCALRREECADLTFEHIQQREARWVIVDLVGKRRKTRSVPMPSWTKSAIDAWAAAADLASGRIFRPVNKGGRLAGEQMTAQSIYETVRHYAEEMDLPVKPHDLRRTFAKLARKAGGDLKQIQITLGHSSIKTTEIYLGEEQNLTDAPCDRLGLSLSSD